MGLNLTAIELAVLAAGRLPEWTQASGAEILVDVPGTGDGAPMQSRTRTAWALDLRANPAKRAAYLTIVDADDPDLAAVYAVEVNGVACAYDADAEGATELGDIVDGLAAVIASTAPDGITASSDGTSIRILAGFDSFAVTDFSAATCEVVAEPDFAEVQVWGQAVGLPGWRLLHTGPVGPEGAAGLLDTGGLSRVALRLVHARGAPTDDADVVIAAHSAAVGPARLEGGA